MKQRMRCLCATERVWLCLLVVLCGFALRANAAPREHPPLTDLTVAVIDAVDHKPVFQARLTLEFPDPNSRLGKSISYSAKTDTRGKYKFSSIPMGPVVLIVTATDHQSFGQQFQVTKAHQVIRIVLKRPQPLR